MLIKGKNVLTLKGLCVDYNTEFFNKLVIKKNNTTFTSFSSFLS